VYVAVASNLAIAISKFVAAANSGSPSMLAEGIHSTVDTANELLLLVRHVGATQRADRRHPFGYGKVLYVWSLVVALFMFVIGGCVSIYNGVVDLRDPPALQDPFWNYVVLGVALAFES